MQWAPVSNTIDGYYPGQLGFEGQVHGQSQFLQDINSQQHYEGQHVFSIWSANDEVVNAGTPGGRSLVWGKNTNEIPGRDGEAE